MSEGYNKDRIFPSVESMTINGGLKPLYNFLYHATSRTVHFSPNVLLRTGWFKEGEPIEFSTKNFRNYYSIFNLYYGTYLFTQFAKIFKKELGLDKTVVKKISGLEDLLKSVDRVPEIVTFEEMNIRRPDATEIHVFNMIAQMPKEELSEFLKSLPDLATFLEKQRGAKDKRIAEVLRRLAKSIELKSKK